MVPDDSEFIIGDMHFAAQRWGNPQGKPVIALHGWLDNSASFDFIAPLLPELDLLCPDLAGHGKTDHRGNFGAYNIWQDVGEVFAMADALGWDKFSLIGHSRGAVIAALAAGTFPDRIENLALIEGVYPRIKDSLSAPQLLAEAIKSLNQQAVRHQSIHSSWEQAVAARTQGLTKVTMADAEVLARRGVEAFEGGYTWAHDYKLLASSEVRYSAEQFDAFIQRIDLPIHLLLGAQGMIDTIPLARAWVEQQAKLQITILDGNHHLHMSGNATAVAQWLRHILLPTAAN